MRVLLVEDDPKMAALVRRGLTENGTAIDIAPKGEDALWLTAAHDYDAIVLDVMLPGIDGFDTCAALRKKGVWAPVLMLTARDAVEDRVAGLDAGADDYLTKPFDMGELKARLRALTRRGGAVRTEEIRIGTLTLDRMAHEIRIGEKKLKLTPKEYKLLEFFLLRPDQVITRTDLLENVWDIHFDPGSNIVDAHVARMRSKLRVAAGAPQLETVRGFGFRLVSVAQPAE